ncbi:glycosyltransferase family 4 protein [Aliikangiella sp. IMCC44653]
MSKEERRVVYFIGTEFSRPVSGGQLYNAKVVEEFAKRDDVEFYPIDYPWPNFLGGLLFDFKTARSIVSHDSGATVIFDESMHQRMFITLLTSLIFKRVKTVIMLHQLAYTRRENRLHYRLTKKLDEWMLKACDIAISAGICVKELAEELAGKKHRHKIKTVLTTVQSEVKYNADKTNHRLLFVGSVVPQKGVHYLVEAVAALPPQLKQKIRVEIAGSLNNQTYLTEVKDLIHQHGLDSQFEFLGLLKFAQLEKSYASAQLFVFPSLSENMPMAVLEAMTAGCIPVVFNNSAMPYLIENGKSGLIVENLNSQALTKAIESYYAMDVDAQKALAYSAHCGARQYAKSWQALANDYIQTVLEVSSNSNKK